MNVPARRGSRRRWRIWIPLLAYLLKSAYFLKRIAYFVLNLSIGKSMLRVVLLTSLLLFSYSRTSAEEIDFASQIEPIFAKHCISCHGSEEQKSGLRLDRRASLLRGGDYGEAAIVPGNPNASFLVKVVHGDEPDLQMPPEGDPLTKQQISLLTRWIKQGAQWPGQMNATADDIESDHWSLQPLSAIQPPQKETSQTHPIDAFIVKALHEKSLVLSEPADPTTLIRRVTLVLTGLPPTPNEVEQFVNHPNGIEVAYGQAVDRLLASPRYGERWAQHWLDVIRWAETVGFETNKERPDAWHYRDWVIGSLNDDKPYDRFVFEQLAGDTVGEDAALGFLVAGPANLPGQIGRDEEAMRQARQDELDEVIRTVSQGLFGLTIGCARCHNHKFDPILQRDYYAMQAMFAGLSYGNRRLRGDMNDKWTEQVPSVRESLRSQRAELESLRKNHQLQVASSDIQTDMFEPIKARSVRMEIAATTNAAAASLYEFQVWTVDAENAVTKNIALASAGAVPSASSFELANQTRHFDNLVDGSSDRRQAFPWVAATQGPAWLQIDLQHPAMIDRVVWDRGNNVPSDYVIKVLPVGEEQWQVVASTSNRLPREDDTRKADKIKLAHLSSKQVEELVNKISEIRKKQANLTRLAAGPKVYAANFTDSPPSTWLLRRGDAMQRVEEIPPAIPLVLGNLKLSTDHPEKERRLALAAHLTQSDHPLTARVIVNRVWQQHFGIGLIDTPSDLGKMGSPPSHPELLDWLAADFVKGGWSLKRLHRQIVLSQTFRQASQPDDDALSADAESRLLWRFPPRRLEAEAIRDSILGVSGKLNLQMGGRGFDLFDRRGGLSDYHPKETFDTSGWRRMVYAHKVRMQSVDIFGAFDCPDSGQMKPRRTRSITPLQSLSLLNSPFVLRQAKFFAERVAGEAGDKIDLQVELAFRLAFSRAPSEVEKQPMETFTREQGLAQLCRVLMNASEFLYIQ